MADMNKAEKLAAARKKLREFQHSREQPARSITPSLQTSPQYKNGVGESCKPDETSTQSLLNKTNHIENCTGEEKTKIFDVPDAVVGSSPLIYESAGGIAAITSSTPISASNKQTDEDEKCSLDLVHSTSETLRQLAMQMNGLLGQELDATGSPTIIAEEVSDSDRSDLLSRNQQLAATLAQKNQALDHLKASLAHLQKQASEREEELRQALGETDKKWCAEVTALRKQLQLHTQTVGILVAEKTEAQSALGRAQLAAKTKAAEAEEAQGRLRASRQKLSELEAALAALKADQEQAQNVQSESVRLREQIGRITEEHNESKEEASQLQQRLQSATQQVSTLQSELIQKQSQLSIAQVRLQQLGGVAPGNSEVTEIQADLQAEHEKCTVLERELVELKNSMFEKEQASQQYQQFIQQLNTQLSSLAAKLQESSEENESLSERNQSLVRHLGELESRMQQVQPATSVPSPQDHQEKENLRKELAAIKEEKTFLKNKLDTQDERVSTLEQELARSEERIAELQEGRPDEVKLLAAMESDKVAAARATAQNTQLKQQLLELQHVQAQLVDQLRHYQVKSQNSEALQRDLVQAQEELKVLKSSESKEDFRPEESLTPEAAQKLQERFTEAMRRLAEISDEKQSLEHLVMQLQGETETIGEYVALYQQQRGVLQQRAAEKDREVARMAADREEMRQKLQQVSQLVSVLATQVSHRQNQDAESKEGEESQAKGISADLAGQISALLSDIGESESLAAPIPECPSAHHPVDTMLPCPLCSGRLEVV